MFSSYIYKLSTPESDLVYIGSTYDINRRLMKHKSPSNRTTSRFLGKDKSKYKIDIIEKVNFKNRNELIDKEMEHIRNTFNCINYQKYTVRDRERIREERLKAEEEWIEEHTCEIKYISYKKK